MNRDDAYALMCQYTQGEGLRRHMSLTQDELAELLGVRQQTISEWERGAYAPSRSTSKYLSMVAEKAGFTYRVRSEKE